MCTIETTASPEIAPGVPLEEGGMGGGEGNGVRRGRGGEGYSNGTMQITHTADAPHEQMNKHL